MSNDVISQLRTYLDFAAGESLEEALAAAPSAKPVARWYQRGPAVAAVSALVVLAVGLPAILLGSDSDEGVASDSGSEVPSPVRSQLKELGCRADSSVEVRVASAELVSGRAFELWVIRPTEGAAANGTILFEVGKPGEALIACNDPTSPMPQVWATAASEASIEGTLLQVHGRVPATAAVVEVTFDDGSSSRIDVQSDGYFLGLIPGPGVDQSPGQPEADLPDVAHITALTNDGEIVAEENFEPLDEPEAAGPEVTLAEGTYQGSSALWRLSAFETIDGNLCIRLEGMGCVADISAAQHLGAVLGSTSFGLEDGARWCVYGPVKEADAVQILLPDGSWISAPIYTNETFSVDFYAHCGLGEQPTTQVRALDSAGIVIDQAPGPDTSG